MNKKQNRISRDLVRCRKALSSAIGDLKRATEWRNQMENKVRKRPGVDDVAINQRLLSLKYERMLLQYEIKMLRDKVNG